MNIVILRGNLTRDPEVRHTQGGTAVCNFGLCTSRRYKRGEEWVDEPCFFDVALWGARGEAFARFHKKGDPALVQGYLKLDEWEDRQTGQKRNKLKVVAESWEFAGARGEVEAPPAERGPATTDETPF